jgi:hypothetical protein
MPISNLLIAIAQKLGKDFFLMSDPHSLTLQVTVCQPVFLALIRTGFYYFYSVFIFMDCSCICILAKAKTNVFRLKKLPMLTPAYVHFRPHILYSCCVQGTLIIQVHVIVQDVCRLFMHDAYK